MTSLAASSRSATAPRRALETRRPSGLATASAAAAVTLSFLPYLAVPLGGSTSVSVSALLGLFAWVIGPRVPRVDLAVVLVGALPLLAMAITTLFFDTPLPPTAAVTWLGAAGAFAAGAVGVLCMRDKLASLLAWLVLLTSLFGFFQYFALRAGFIPFVELYRAPGYASVEANAPAILLYIRRPFAQFPEPSFMAGSLTLAVLAMLLIARYFGRTRLRRVEKAAVLAGAIVIVLSESGSAVAGLGAIAVALLASSARSIGAQIRAALLIVLAAAGAIWVIEQRSSILNFSWGDRMMSIIASAQFWASDIQTFLFGLGRGGLTAAYSSGRVDVSGFQFTQQPPDVFSAIGRVLFESGLFAGGAVLLILVLLIVRGGALVAPLFSVAMITAWLVVGGITISYESAAFIWLLPGVCMGVIAVRRGSGNE